MASIWVAANVTHEEKFCLAVVDDVVYLVGHELMQDRYGYGTIGEGSEECYCPVGTVATAEGNLVTLDDTRILEHDV